VQQINSISFGGGETVLLIESSPALQKLGKSVLEKLNYRALTAEDGRQVLTRRMLNHKIDLLILDGAAPISDSKKLVEQVRNLHPEAKVLFSTVHDIQLKTECGQKVAREKLITKPFNISELSRTLFESLN
jgi:DNA-binding response OmpR family regulator